MPKAKLKSKTTSNRPAQRRLRVQRMVGPHDRTIKRRLKELRNQIDTSKDPAVQRISYAMECGIRWAREKTVGWESPAITARDLAVMLRRELNAQPKGTMKDNTETSNQAAGATAFGSSDLLGVNRVGNAILCVAWGEQDRPDATIAQTAEDVKAFIVGEWIGDPEDPLVSEVLKELSEHDWREDGTLKYEFEVGGITFQDVIDVSPNESAARRSAAQPPLVIVNPKSEAEIAADVFNPNETDLEYFLRRSKALREPRQQNADLSNSRDNKQ